MFRTRSKSTSGHKRSTLDHTKSRTAGRNFFPPDETGFQQETITIGRSKLPNCRPRFLPPVPKSVSAGNDRDPSLQSFESRSCFPSAARNRFRPGNDCERHLEASKRRVVLSCRRSKSTSAGNDHVLASGSFRIAARAFLRPKEANFHEETIKFGISRLRILHSCFLSVVRNQLSPGNDHDRVCKASQRRFVL